jgi:membrane protease YdiL (CAAX protease family)
MASNDPPSRRDRATAVLALMLLAPVPTIGVTCAMLAMPDATGRAVFGAAKVWLVVFPAVWYLAVERGVPSWSPVRRGGLAVGAAVGLVLGAAILVGYRAVIGPLVDPAAVRHAAASMGLASPARFLAAAAGWTLVNSVIEEYVYRWFILRELRALVPDAAAVVGSAAIFTAHHSVAMSVYLDPWPAVLGSAGVLLGGTIWSGLYVRFGSVWPGWLSHALVDVAVFAVGWRLLFG